MTTTTPPLRRELLYFPLANGGVEVLDLVLERLHTFDADEASQIEAGRLTSALETKLQTAMLLEGPTANLIRQASRHGRTRSQMPSPTLPTGDSNDGPWALASALPSELFASAWREPERWRRLAEERRAGRTLLRLDGLFTTDAALELRKAAAALPFEERHTTYVRGAGCELEDHHLTSWRSALTHGPCNALLSAVMDEDLPERMFARVWKLGQGDGISVHKDGIHYVATLSIGLCPGWTASHGGAIAFGQPTAQGLDVVERWLPHLGDALLFRPTALAWHAVEPVEHGMRYTLTTHYVSPQYGAA